MDPRLFRRVPTALSVLALVLVATRCSDAPPAPSSVLPAPDEGVAGLIAEGRGSRASAALERTSWVAELHTAAMAELTQDRKAFARIRTASKRVQCATAWSLAMKYGRRGAAQAGVPFDAQLVKFAQVRMAEIGCGTGYTIDQAASPPLSLFATMDGEEVTDAAFSYLGDLAGALGGTNTPDAAADAANSVLGTASGLGAADYELVAAMAGFGVESISSWYSFGASGGWGGGGGTGETSNAMSLFRFGWLERVGAVGRADLGGALACAGAAWVSGMRDYRVLLPVALICGTINSAVEAM